jgi:hypothetical protein
VGRADPYCVFQGACFNKLVAYAVAQSEGFEPTARFVADPDYAKLAAWYSELTTSAEKMGSQIKRLPIRSKTLHPGSGDANDGSAAARTTQHRRLAHSSLSWSYECCESDARISYEANLIDPEAAWVQLTYTVHGHPMNYRIRLVATPAELWRS